jgi:hypothetical protein
MLEKREINAPGYGELFRKTFPIQGDKAPKNESLILEEF